MNKIAEMRKKAGLTQSKLSTAIGVSRSTLAMYETNKSEPDFKTISKLADFFGVSVDYLLGREEKSPAARRTPHGVRGLKSHRYATGL